jgi:phosphoglycerate dehydrogenase-like enzyme
MRVAILDDYQNVALRMADWASLKPRAEVQNFTTHIASIDELTQKLSDFGCVVLMRERTPFPRTLIEKLPKLKLLITAGMRNASVDVDAATERGVQFCGTATVGPPTAELTWGLIIGALRSIAREDAGMRKGAWQTTLGSGLHGKVLGVIGLGRLGTQVAKIGKAFGMEVIAWSQNLTAARAAEAGATLVDKDTLFGRADVATIHLVLSDRSRGLVGARDLAGMKKMAWLINTSRGPIVDEKALLAALHAKQIAGAGLDVYDVEPLPADHPFRKLDNVILTPHLGYVTEENYRTVYGDAVANIAAFLDGKVLKPINQLKPR